MNIEEVRGLVIMALKKGGWNQFSGIVTEVGRIKAKLLGQFSSRHINGRSYLEQGDESKINEVVWSFITQGILVPGSNDSNLSWPHLRLTDYGKQCIEAEEILPHDPDGYLREFSKQVPQADPVITEYLAESLQCFLHGLQRAAAVMLGGASEKTILALVDSFGYSIQNKAKQKKYITELKKAPSIYQKYEVFEKRFNHTKGDLPRELGENLDSLLRGVFDLIRSSRNDAGHPASGVAVDRDVIYSHLRLFIPYCKRIYGLIEWFANNPT